MTKLLICFLLMLAPITLSAQSDFNLFFTKFKSAVSRNDKAAVKGMMAARFEWALDGHVSRDEAWGYFNGDKGNWAALKQAVNRKPAVCKSPFCNNRSGYHTW